MRSLFLGKKKMAPLCTEPVESPSSTVRSTWLPETLYEDEQNKTIIVKVDIAKTIMAEIEFQIGRDNVLIFLKKIKQYSDPKTKEQSTECHKSTWHA